jgi:hypothetical protein
MTRSAKCAAVVGIAFGAWMQVQAAGASELDRGSAREELSVTLTAEHPFEIPEETSPMYSVLPGPETEKAALRFSFTTFTNSVLVGRKRYTFTMVGTDPSQRNAKNAVIPIVVIPVRSVFDDGTTLDATAPDPCAGDVTPLALVAESPIFLGADYGDGIRQYVEEFRRVEFWAFTGAPGARNPNYSVSIAGSLGPTLIVSFHGFPTQATPCGRRGLVDLHGWDGLAQKAVFPLLRARGIGANALVLFLFSNVEFYQSNQNNCCVLGYHSWFSFHGLQTYGVAEYDTNQNYQNITDISVLSHEIGEWYDDPLGSNATPPWGHVGQVSGCQGNLEVGDPLSGHLFLPISMPNGVTYNPQELAFFSWFFGEVPSLGFSGWYSGLGTFRSPATPCH